MAIRKDVVWTVAEDGVTFLPTTPQEGGVQGEDKAVRVKFVLGASHPLVTGGYPLYIECVDSAGGYDKTEALAVDEAEGAVAVAVPLCWTQYGGTIRLNVAAEKEGECIILDGVQLAFRSRNTALKRIQMLIHTTIQRLMDRATAAVASAQAAADSAATSAQEAAVAVTGANASARAAADSAAAAEDKLHQMQVSKEYIGSAASAAVSAGEAAQAARDEARNHANAAGIKAAAAETSAQAAEQAAGSAAASAQEAAVQREGAAAHATKAEEAAERAESARGAASNLANSVYENAAAAKTAAEEAAAACTDVDVTDDGEGRVTVRVAKGAAKGAGWPAVPEINGCAIVSLDGKWVASDIPVADKNDFFNIVSGLSGCENRILALENAIGDIDDALDELHAYAQALIGGEGE